MNRETLGSVRTIDHQRIGGSGKNRSKGSIRTRSVKSEVIHIRKQLAETDLIGIRTRTAFQNSIVHNQSGRTGTPFATFQIELNFHLFRVRLSSDVTDILLEVIAGYRDSDLIVRILQVIQQDLTLRTVITPDATLGHRTELIRFIGSHIHNLGNLTGTPAVTPEITLHLQNMIVEILGITDLQRSNLLRRIILIQRIDIPTLDTVYQVITLTGTPLTLEITIAKKVLTLYTVTHRKLGLQSQIGYTYRIDRQTVTVYENTLVRSYRITISMIFIVIIIESTRTTRYTRGRIRKGFIAGIVTKRVVDTQTRLINISFKANAGRSNRIRINLLVHIVRTHTHLNRITVITRTKVVKTHLLVSFFTVALVHRIL